MSRGSINAERTGARVLRCAAVWLLATATTATTWWQVAPAGAALATATGWSAPLDVLLVRICAAVLLPCTAWLWVVTTTTVVDVVRGCPRVGGTARRWVLLACGVALAAGSAAPAAAHGGDSGPAVLAGLAMPDRAVAQPLGGRPVAGPDHVVLSGDTLWSIAASHPAGMSVDERWRAIWAANRDVIGDDPDLILPGQHLTLPPTDDDRTSR